MRRAHKYNAKAVALLAECVCEPCADGDHANCRAIFARGPAVYDCVCRALQHDLGATLE